METAASVAPANHVFNMYICGSARGRTPVCAFPSKQLSLSLSFFSFSNVDFRQQRRKDGLVTCVAILQDFLKNSRSVKKHCLIFIFKLFFKMFSVYVATYFICTWSLIARPAT